MGVAAVRGGVVKAEAPGSKVDLGRAPRDIHTAAIRQSDRGTTVEWLSTPVIAGLLFTATLAAVALMAWKGDSERRDVTFLASAAGVGGVCTAAAAVLL